MIRPFIGAPFLGLIVPISSWKRLFGFAAVVALAANMYPTKNAKVKKKTTVTVATNARLYGSLMKTNPPKPMIISNAKGCAIGVEYSI
jgi:hypothetical protein